MAAVLRRLIEAISCRYPTSQNPLPEEFAKANETYAASMEALYRELGSADLTITSLAADALMNMAPWQLYEPRTGRPNLDTPVLKITDILTAGMKLPNADSHPGLLHMFIHLKEMSSTPEMAINAADKLRHLLPDAGHMLHMPSHIDFWVGDYRKAIESNTRATIADQRFFAMRPDRIFYKIYLLHNYHSLVYACMLAGQLTEAIRACDNIEQVVTEQLLQVQSPPMAEWTESFLSIRIHVFIRFGLWDQLKALKVPDNKELYCVLNALTYYGKAVGKAATSEDARQDQALFREAAKRVPETRLDFPNKMTDILKVAEAMLEAEVQYRLGNHEAAFRSLRNAIKHEDSLIYSEPWAWMLPSRHALGALLLEQGHVEDAARAYAEDLGLDGDTDSAHHHPNNIWGLHGYHECLTRLGRVAEAHIIKQMLTKASAMADVPVASSCFCRLDAQPSTLNSPRHTITPGNY